MMSDENEDFVMLKAALLYAFVSISEVLKLRSDILAAVAGNRPATSTVSP